MACRDVRYGRFDLLCLNELGYVHLDIRGSELLFQILTEREEKSSVAVASNLPFRKGGRSSPTPASSPSSSSRVTINAQIIDRHRVVPADDEMGLVIGMGEPYRPRRDGHRSTNVSVRRSPSEAERQPSRQYIRERATV